MATDNETVRMVTVDAIGGLVLQLYDKEKIEKLDIKDVWSLVQQVATRVEAAHEREKPRRTRRSPNSASA